MSKQVTTEKCAMAYLEAAKRKSKNTPVNYSEFSKAYDDLFLKKYPPQLSKSKYKEFKLYRFNKIDALLQGKTVDEIQQYRNNVALFSSREVPEDIKRAAMKKGFYVTLEQDLDTCLSGFNLVISKGRLPLTNVPYGLNEKEVRELIENTPSEKEKKVLENQLLELLHDETAPKRQKMIALNKYNVKHPTHDFQVRMNRYIFKYCKDRDLLIEAVSLHMRLGIKDLQRNKEITSLGYVLSKKKTVKKNKRKNTQNKGEKSS